VKNGPARWRSDYERDGYLVVEDALDKPTLERLRRGIAKITADPDGFAPLLRRWLDLERDFIQRRPQYNELAVSQVDNAVRNIQELPLFAPMFAELIVYPPLLDVLQVLFASTEFHFHNYKCIVKAPRVSSKFRWHRDLPYPERSTPNLITAMLCLDPMTERNGATVILPGTHGIGHEPAKPGDKDIPETDLPAVPRVTVTCPAGAAVLFHVNIIHGGGANRSEHPRRNIIGIWAGPDTYPVTVSRLAYDGLMSRSADPTRQRHVRMSFPRLFAQSAMDSAQARL
jgi:ectoine hydroxylase-related dioxygenase (phytanoyl-CoA dioxygenase family)